VYWFEATCWGKTWVKFSSQQQRVQREDIYLCIKIVLVDPSSPSHRALQRVDLFLCCTLTWTPGTFTASVYRSNTGSIDTRKGTRRRTEWGEEVFLVIIGGTDVMDEVVADGLRTERAPSGWF
jgi:hypothetical protein